MKWKFLAALALLCGLFGCTTSKRSANATFNVVSYGADATGIKDSTVPIRNAIFAAEQGTNNRVWFPAGTYILNLNDGLNKDFVITKTVHIEGAGPTQTKLIEEIGAKRNLKSKTIFQIQADYTTVNNMSLDSAMFDAGTTIMDFANNTELSHLVVLGPRSTPNYNSGQFGIRVIAICAHDNFAVVHHSYNVVHDITVTGQGGAGNTDIDLSCQENDDVYNINDTGNGIDLYIVQNVSVSNVQHHETVANQHSIVITAPSTKITINNFQTWGSGGQIEPSLNGYTSEVTITNETMHDLSQTLAIGDASVKLNQSQLGVIKIDAVTSATVQLNGVTYTTISCLKKMTVVLMVAQCS